MASDHSAYRRLLAGALLTAALIVVPGAWQASAPALRYSTFVSAGLAVVGLAIASLLCFVPQRPPSRRWLGVLAAAVIVKACLGLLDTPVGWRAEYTTLTPEPPKVGTFAWRLGHHAFRVDPELMLNGPSFELQFLNDFHRYNGRMDAPPRATSKALRVVWTGWFESPAAGELTVRGSVSGAVSALLDGRAWFAEVRPDAEVARATAVPGGRHRLEVVYDKPAGRAPAASLAFALDGSPLRPTPWPDRSHPGSGAPGRLSDGLVATGVGLFVLMWLSALWEARARAGGSVGGALVTLVAVAWLMYAAVVQAAPFQGVTYEFTPGDDHLAYEGLSRNILEEGVLMPEHRPLGQGTPFFFYPLYSYVLAGAHLVLGDSHAAVVFVNAAAAAALPALFWLLGWRGLPLRAQVIGQLLLIVFVTRHHTRYFESPLTDNLFIPLIVGTLVLATRAVRSSRSVDAFVTGCAVAACATTRPSAFLLIPLLAMLFAWFSTGSRWQRFSAVAALAAGYAVALAPVVFRNWIVAGQPVAMVTLSHAIPISLIPPEAQTPEALKRAALWTWSASLQLAGHMIAADPWGIAWLEARKLLFTLGVTSLGPAGTAMIWEFPVLCLAGLAAFARRQLPRNTSAVLLTFLVSHLAAITIAYPWTYGYKTILPVQLVFLFAATHLLTVAGQSSADARDDPARPDRGGVTQLDASVR